MIALSSMLGACAFPNQEVEGGANANDRSDGGNDGVELLTGSMVLSPPAPIGADGQPETTAAYGLMQRNTVSVFVDFQAGTARELDIMVDRWVFSPNNDVGYAVIDDDLKALVLPTLDSLWVAPATVGSVAFLRVSADGRSLVVADGLKGSVLDATTGTVRTTFAVGDPEDVAFLPDGEHALVVGQTTWTEHVPSTPVLRLNLYTGEAVSVSVPNCTAPIAVLPAGTRALLSPTFCQEGASSTSQNSWTNPDPVSIIDLFPDGPHFVKNLPGFGPVALSETGDRAVAYLDKDRMDPSMFDDPAQIPDSSAPRYHLMVIDPATLAFSLTPIGDALPRFALSRDGKTLLVDATVQVWRGKIEASADVSIDTSGIHAAFKVGVFKQNAPFGSFDLDLLVYRPFSGPEASLDRFVMPRSGKDVYTLKRTADGLGGDLFRIQLQAGTTVNLQRSLRDLGLFPDGETLVLRIRTSPLQVQGGVRLQEQYCLSLDGQTCTSTIYFTSKLVFQSAYCSDPANYHDC